MISVFTNSLVKMDMKLIVGLGNPGQKYIGTRHNIGFEVVDLWANEIWATQFLFEKKFNALVAVGIFKKWKLLFLKPQTYMNLSGDAVSRALNFYKIVPDQMLVAHDELDLPLGEIKLKRNGGHNGHRGIKDIMQKASTDKFWRLKIGIGRPDNPQIDVVDWVLSKFSEEEKQKILAQKKLLMAKLEEFLKYSS